MDAALHLEYMVNDNHSLIDYDTIMRQHHVLLNDSPMTEYQQKEIRDALGQTKFERDDAVEFGIVDCLENDDLLVVSKATYQNQKLVLAIAGVAKQYSQEGKFKRFEFTTIKLIPASAERMDLPLDDFTGPVLIGTLGYGLGGAKLANKRLTFNILVLFCSSVYKLLYFAIPSQVRRPSPWTTRCCARGIQQTRGTSLFSGPRPTRPR
jgi:hypothetical protein